jgi:hypothetical protein
MGTPETHHAARSWQLKKRYGDSLKYLLSIVGQYIIDSEAVFHFYLKLEPLMNNDRTPFHDVAPTIADFCSTIPVLEPLHSMKYHCLDDHTWHQEAVAPMAYTLVRENKLLRALAKVNPQQAFDLAHLKIETVIGNILADSDPTINRDIVDSLEIGRAVAPCIASLLSTYYDAKPKYFRHALYSAGLLLEYNAHKNNSMDEWQTRGAMSDGNHGRVRDGFSQGLKPILHFFPSKGQIAQYIAPKGIAGLEWLSARLTPPRIRGKDLETLMLQTERLVRTFDGKHSHKVGRRARYLPDSPLPYIMALPHMREHDAEKCLRDGTLNYAVRVNPALLKL